MTIFIGPKKCPGDSTVHALPNLGNGYICHFLAQQAWSVHKATWVISVQKLKEGKSKNGDRWVLVNRCEKNTR